MQSTKAAAATHPTMTVRDTIGIITTIEGPNTTTGQRQTTGGIPKPYQMHMMILPL